MRRAAFFVAVVALMLASAGQAGTTAALSASDVPDVGVLAAGRVRFVDGATARMTVEGTTVAPDVDYLVLVGAAFRTEQSRLELQTLNGDLFWFDRGTDFHFEESDPAGAGTTLFLGRGSLVVTTKAPFTLVTGAGTLLIPADGTYSVSKGDPGKARTAVATVAGPSPEVLEHSTMFSKFSLKAEPDQQLLAWQQQREANWERTLMRADMFSNVGLMSPMLAYTDAAGKLQWRRVATAHPLTWAADVLRTNYYVGGFGYPYLRATGLLPAGLVGESDFVVSLWFRTNWYNSLRWAWNVPLGWHAEWYWDPLGGWGAEFSCPGWSWPYPTWASTWWWHHWRRGRPDAYRPWVFEQCGPRTPLRGVIPKREGRAVRVRLAESSRLRERLTTDPGLGSLRHARSLDARLEENRNGGARRPGRSGGFVGWGHGSSGRFSTSPSVTSTPQTSQVTGERQK